MMDTSSGLADEFEKQRSRTSSHNLSHIETEPKFLNIDEPSNLDQIMQALSRSSSQNFVLDFNDTDAYAAHDIPVASFGIILQAERQAATVRWINIWYPYHQQFLLEMLARRYDFSPRLLGLMCSDPRRPRSKMDGLKTRSSPPNSFRRMHRRPSHASSIENGMDELSEHSSISSYDSIARGNLYRIVDDLWHYTSVDYGRSYICVGYNSLYGTKNSGAEEGNGPLPYCIRVWTWLLLCEDGTVISINEDPFPLAYGQLDCFQQRIVLETRRSLATILCSLSKVGKDSLMAHKPMALLPLRMQLGDTPEETTHRASDAPGLLFYYLFENWQNSYSLIIRRDSRYDIELAELRKQMFIQPTLAHIDRLDTIGKELGVLRRHYHCYIRVIDRLIETPRPSDASVEISHIAGRSSQTSFDTVRPLVTERQSTLGVSLSSAARLRFARLKDLIDLYALSEVEEYIKRKDSLVTMNFNLIAMQESLDMDRLNRVTLLITKATILFLPVSLMTTYFGCQLSSVEYTVRDYWISFAVIFLLSWAALFIFGVFSGNVETLLFFSGLRQAWETVSGKLIRTSQSVRQAMRS